MASLDSPLAELRFATNLKSQRSQSNRKSWFPYNLLTEYKVSKQQKQTCEGSKSVTNEAGEFKFFQTLP